LLRRRGRNADVEIVTDESTRGEAASMLDEICREGARRMLAAALEAEAAAYIAEVSERQSRTSAGSCGCRSIRLAPSTAGVNGRAVECNTRSDYRLRAAWLAC
jgi:hypothetical protein